MACRISSWQTATAVAVTHVSKKGRVRHSMAWHGMGILTWGRLLALTGADDASATSLRLREYPVVEKNNLLSATPLPPFFAGLPMTHGLLYSRLLADAAARGGGKRMRGRWGGRGRGIGLRSERIFTSRRRLCNVSVENEGR